MRAVPRYARGKSVEHPIRRYCANHPVKDKPMQQAIFAEVVGASPQMICCMIAGRKRPSYPLAAAIQTATGGEVTIGELMTWEPEKDTAA